VLLNDQSGSTKWPVGIKQQTEVADEFLTQVVTAGDDIGGLVNFGDDVYIDVQNEKDPLKLAGKLERKGVGGTKLYDAVVSAGKWLAKQSVNPEHRKVMFLFCDGEDNTTLRSYRHAPKSHNSHIHHFTFFCRDEEARRGTAPALPRDWRTSLFPATRYQTDEVCVA
jgi:von Willebrand factor type A domain